MTHELPEDAKEFNLLLQSYNGNAAEMARQTGISVDRIKRIRAKFRSAAAKEATYPLEPEWGLGGPQRVEPSTDAPDEVIVGLFDVHFPHHDTALLASSFAVIADIQPDTIIVGGDLYDNSLLSRWEVQRRSKTAPGRLFKMVREDLARVEREFWKPLREAAPNATIRLLEGNHDDRLRNWLIDDDVVEGIQMANEWMGLANHGVHWHSRAGVLVRPEFLIRHGEVLTTNAAKAEQERTRCSGWIGHGHKERHWHEELPETGRRYTTWMAPVISRRDYSYGPGGAGLARWPQGFLVGTLSTTNQYDHVTEVARWMGDYLLFRGRRY